MGYSLSRNLILVCGRILLDKILYAFLRIVMDLSEAGPAPKEEDD
jgi:hypothetical protein